MSLLFLIPLLPLLGFAINGLAYPEITEANCGHHWNHSSLGCLRLITSVILEFRRSGTNSSHRGLDQSRFFRDPICLPNRSVVDLNAPCYYGSGHLDSRVFDRVYVP